MASRQPTLAIGGPTATGKTALAVELARRMGAELVNADSRQVVRRLVVGTARPTEEELNGVRCHLLDLCEPGEPFTVADWTRHARHVLADLDARGIPAVVVGGTGQYLRALRQGWDFGGVSPLPSLREELTDMASTPAGMGLLAAEVRERDPSGAAALDLANPRRLVRAVELLRAGNASLATGRRRAGGRMLALAVLDADRDTHRRALAARMDAMFATGAILAEVCAELERGTTPVALRRAGIGYAEALRVLAGDIDSGGATALAAQRTSRYVKAQRTWFRQEPAALRLERDDRSTASVLADAIESELATNGGSPR